MREAQVAGKEAWERLRKVTAALGPVPQGLAVERTDSTSSGRADSLPWGGVAVRLVSRAATHPAPRRPRC